MGSGQTRGMKSLALVLALTLSFFGARAAEPALTLYNQGFGVVREQIPLDLKEGTNTVTTSEVTAHLEPASVILRDPTGATELQIIEQNYRNDPVSQDLLLQHFEGQSIPFKINSDTNIIGKIVRAPYILHDDAPGKPIYWQRQMAMVRSSGNQPLIEVDGKLRFGLPGHPLFPSLSDDSILKPTLSWTLQSAVASTSPVELAYVSQGFSWEADYNLIGTEKDDNVTMIGWITMRNDSGRSFPEAQIKLVAGDVSKVEEEGRMRKDIRAMAFGSGAAQEEVTEKAFDEFHLYTLPRRTTLRDREMKQVEFIRAENVPGRTVYIYNGADINQPQYRNWQREQMRDDQSFGVQSHKEVWVYREVKNTKENGLGLPLPKGTVRFYREDSADRQLEFVGENTIDHTPKDETLKIYTGNAFDLVGERKRTNIIVDSGRSTLTESFEITLRNHKTTPVTIKVVESLYRWSTWEITESSDTHEKTDSQTMEFLAQLEPDAEKVITYTVRYTW